PACTWVKLEASARDVLVLPAERLAPDCRSLGKVKVSVLDKVGVLARHAEGIVADLDPLARNHAAKVGGATAGPRGPENNGIREYEIFRCTAPSAPGQAREQPEQNEVEVLPYEGGDR